MRIIWAASLLIGTLASANGASATDLSTERDARPLAPTVLSQWRGGDRDDANSGGWNRRDNDNGRGDWNRRGNDDGRWNNDRRDNDWRNGDWREGDWRDSDRKDRDWRDRDRDDDRWNDDDRYRRPGSYYYPGNIYRSYNYGNYGSYGVPRFRDPNENRAWDNGWRRDDRYNWSDYRRQNGDLYRSGSYADPYANRSYSRFRIGLRVGAPYYNSRYWIGDPWRYRLPPVYGNYRWVRYYDDVLLIDTRSGYIQDAIYGFFW